MPIMLFQRTQFALISITKRNGGVLRIPPHYTQWLSRYQMIAPVCRSSHSFPGNTRLLSSSPKAYQKRVLGAIAHINSGKTTTSEAMLYAAGALRRMGNVDIGNTMMDFLPAERERGITINAAAICFDWKDHQFFLVDSPGHLDFTFEVERALKVMDGVIVLLDAVAGVQPQTETVWRQADSNGLARVIFVNKMDRDGADFDKTVESVRQNFKTTPAVIQVPIFDKETGRFCGIYDLLERFEGGCMKTGLMGKNDADEDFIGSYDDLSMELKEGVDKAVGHLFETVAEVDDGVMALWIEEKVASKEVMVQALRDACISGELIPVVCGSSLKHIGVEPLMDSVIKYLPSPQERSAVRGVSKGGKDLLIKTCPSAPFLAYAFKVSHDKHRGRLVHLRAFSGDLQEKNKSFLNTTKGKPESPSRLLRVLADKFIDINSVTTGDIFAAVGLKHTETGDTLMLQHGEKGSQIIMDGVPVPPAIFSIALETDSTTQDAILEASLQRLVDEDNSLELNIDSETGETLLSGMGELHLEVAIDHLNRILPFSIHRSSPRVSYRETVTSTATHTEHHDATVGLQHHQATVQVTLQPTEEVGNIIDIPDSNNASPDQKAALLDGAQAGLNRGPIYNAKMAHTKATLIQTCTSDKPPTLPALRAAAAHGVRKCAVKHNGLLEPELSLEITAPHTHMGNITRDLTHGRHSATIESMERTETHCIIRGSIAATSLLKCAARIRSNTQGRAVVRTSFRRYAPAQGHHHA